MSVIAHRKNTAGASPVPAILGFLSKTVRRGTRLLLHIVEVIAEARMQRAAIEAELYLNRYKHSSKNDDDLPIVRWAINEQGFAMTITFRNWPEPKTERAPLWRSSPGKLWSSATRWISATAKQVFPVIAVLAFFAVALAATIALRFVIWLPLYYRH
jgi:hypothetical protein